MIEFFIKVALLFAIIFATPVFVIFLINHTQSKKEANKKISAMKTWRNDKYEFREIMRPKYYGLCGAVKVRQRRTCDDTFSIRLYSEWEDI